MSKIIAIFILFSISISNICVFYENIEDSCEIKIEMDDKSEGEDDHKMNFLLESILPKTVEFYFKSTFTKAQCKEASHYESASAASIQSPPPEL